MDWHRLKQDEVFQLTGSSERGLSSAEAREKLVQDGLNQLTEGKKQTALSLFLAQFKDLMILILLAAAIISGIVGDLKDTVVILIIVMLNAVIGFIQEYRAEQAMLALKKMSATTARVIRDGEMKNVASEELVTGDVVILEAGNAIPADIRIVKSLALKVQEASLTGESESVEKTEEPIDEENLPIGDRTNLGFKGTFVTYGRATGVVIATGMKTELGRIAGMLQETGVLTPLQHRIASFGKRLSLIVLLLCLLFLVTGWLRGEDIIMMIMTSISLAVAAIPEALPAVITITLALAAKRMVKHNTLIRKLPAVETLGSVTYICTDKTGTLTKNKMHVEQVLVGGQRYDRSSLRQVLSDGLHLLVHAFALNNDASVNNAGIRGDSTEVALMEVAQQLGIDLRSFDRLAEIPFDSERKLMTTFHTWKGQIISFTKGAPDVLIERCDKVDNAEIRKNVDDMARDGLRVLGFACRYWTEIPADISEDGVERDLQFLGLAGMIDPPRDEVRQAVSECRKAGIVPVMITGDHPLTAKTIAERIGILTNEEDLVVTGKEMQTMDSARLTNAIEHIKVYARVSPEQKLEIVKMLQQKGHYVAMTGDGVNDAPSLKKANIGIAMGVTGTDVSKEASHMILLDDNFSTIIQAVREGRRVYDNILKFIKYLMTTNSGELWTLLAGPIIGLPVALLPIHILWINLASDGLPAIALSFEKADKDIMNRPPRVPGESVFSQQRGFHIIWVGMLMAAIALTVQAYAIAHELHWQTMVFNVLCLSQMAHVLAIRSEKQSLFTIGIFSNRPLIISVMLVLILQAAITYVPSLQRIFNTQSLTIYEFLAVGAISSIIFFAVELEKLIKRRRA